MTRLPTTQSVIRHADKIADTYDPRLGSARTMNEQEQAYERLRARLANYDFGVAVPFPRLFLVLQTIAAIEGRPAWDRGGRAR